MITIKEIIIKKRRNNNNNKGNEEEEKQKRRILILQFRRDLVRGLLSCSAKLTKHH